MESLTYPRYSCNSSQVLLSYLTCALCSSPLSKTPFSPLVQVVKIEVDTAHFKGNYPESCVVEGCRAAKWATGMVGPLSAQVAQMGPWKVLLNRTKLGPHHRHFFAIAPSDAVTHVRLTMLPDGGISRLRVWCELADKASL